MVLFFSSLCFLCINNAAAIPREGACGRCVFLVSCRLVCCIAASFNTNKYLPNKYLLGRLTLAPIVAVAVGLVIAVFVLGLELWSRYLASQLSFYGKHRQESQARAHANWQPEHDDDVFFFACTQVFQF